MLWYLRCPDEEYSDGGHQVEYQFAPHSYDRPERIANSIEC